MPIQPNCSLDEIARYHNADKASHYHGYTRWYEKHFSRYVGERVTILEIGIAHCFSLLTWRDYFGPGARVVGVDNEIAFLRDAQERGFEGYLCDVLDRDKFREIVEKVDPDIIIDDGGHRADQQVAAFEAAFPKLKNGGLYVVEDLHAAYWKWGGEFMPVLKDLVDKVNHTGKLSLGWAKNEPQKVENLDALEKSVAAMHFYPSIVFIEKGDKTV